VRAALADHAALKERRKSSFIKLGALSTLMRAENKLPARAAEKAAAPKWSFQSPDARCLFSFCTFRSLAGDALFGSRFVLSGVL